jgi:hypothetical protein
MKSSGATRRDLLRKSPLALAASTIVLPPLLASLAGQAKADGTADGVKMAAKYYPLETFNPEIDLRGKLAVITGDRVASVERSARRWLRLALT